MRRGRDFGRVALLRRDLRRARWAKGTDAMPGWPVHGVGLERAWIEAMALGAPPLRWREREREPSRLLLQQRDAQDR